MAGAIYSGSILYGSLPTSPVAGASSALTAGLSLSQLIDISSDERRVGSSFHLRSAIVNNDLLSSAVGVFSTDPAIPSGGDYAEERDYAGELISYVILQTPSQSIDTGVFSKFTLAFSVRGNSVFFPSATDSMAHDLSENRDMARAGHPALQQSRIGYSNSPALSTMLGVGQDVHARHPPNLSLLDKIKRMTGMAWNNREGIMSAISSVASFLAPLMANDDPPVRIACRADYY